MTYIVAGGDTFLTGSLPTINEKILRIIRRADHFLLNLEGPIFHRKKQPSPRSNPVKYLLAMLRKEVQISMTQDAYEQYPFRDNTLWGLANNHILDFGKAGLTSTKKLIRETNRFGLEERCIRSLSTGHLQACAFNLSLVSQSIHSLMKLSARISIPTINDHAIHRIRNQSKSTDVLVGYIHMGKCGKDTLDPETLEKLLETNKLVNPERKPMIILGHHSHQAGRIQHLRTHNLLLIHSLGNFIFPEKLGKFNQQFHYNYLVKVIGEQKNVMAEIIPIYITDSEIRRAKKSEYTMFPTNTFKYRLPL